MILAERGRAVLLTALRVVASLLFFEHGSSKLLDFPHNPQLPQPEAMSLVWFAGVMELVGGALVALGLFTRLVAFLLAGEMAVRVLTIHRQEGFFPLLNGGEAAILYCFIFLYLSAAGPGAWSIDALTKRRRPAD